MKYLSQNNPVWSKERLGESQLTIGRFGCTTTCISMLSDYFNCFQSPVQIAHNAANYTKDGLVIWSNLKFEHMKFERRAYAYEPFTVAQYMKDPAKAVILQVNNGQHWVVAIKKAVIGDDIIVLDPWSGKKVLAKASYHNITGAAYFSSK